MRNRLTFIDDRSRSRASKVWVAAIVAALVLVPGVAQASEQSGRAVSENGSSAIVDSVSSLPDSQVRTANLAEFSPSDIISDALFYDSAAMTTAEIQAFLDRQIGACSNGKCLNVISAGFTSRGAVVSARTGNTVCAPITGGTMRVAEVIYRAQVACGISAKVILVTLQKEQGLVTSRAPSDWNLRAAMGAFCPDTSPCDPAYAGVGPQIIAGTIQLKTYKAGAFSRQPGTHFIGYHPNTACGGTNVLVSNYATAALYNYTPYQPNPAALRAGYGTGDGCSSYGNRNFYQYYVDWFGNTRLNVSGRIADIWNTQGGSAGWMGMPTSDMVYTGSSGSGWYQQFRNGVIFVPRTGAYIILRSGSLITQVYLSSGGPAHALGWPVGGEDCGAYGCRTAFQGGSMAWSNETGSVYPLYGAINLAWLAGGGVNNPIGAPTTSMSTVNTSSPGWHQTFVRAKIFVKSAGPTVALRANSGITQRYNSLGGPSSALGWPVASEECTADGCATTFDGGISVWASKLGIVDLTQSVATAWTASGGMRGLGVPTASPVQTSTAGGGTVQSFSGGSMYVSAAGKVAALRTSSSITQRFIQSGGLAGPFGWPESTETCGAAGCWTVFAGGAIAWEKSSSLVRDVSGAIAQLWLTAGGVNSWHGAPIAAMVATADNGGGWTQRFRNGQVYVKAGGPVASLRTNSGLWSTYVGMGGTGSVLGWPTGGEACVVGGCSISFERGSLVWDQPTGAITQR